MRQAGMEKVGKGQAWGFMCVCQSQNKKKQRKHMREQDMRERWQEQNR